MGTDNFARVFVSDVDNDIEVRSPLGKLPLPGIDGGEGQHEYEGAVYVVGVEEVAHKRNSLDCLP